MKRTGIPRYVKIALDIARKIMSTEIKVGEILKGRTILASEYAVSPETIRKAMNLLDQQGVVEVRQGVGIFVADIIKAEGFVQNYKADRSIRKQQDELEQMFEQRAELDVKLANRLKEIVESFKYRTTESIPFQEVEILEGSQVSGKTIGEVKFWLNTGATIIGVIHDDYITISPGPDAVLLAGDFLLLVGDSGVVGRVEQFLDAGVPDEVRTGTK
jgi:K+/H+ antiporter YhaU regulatory subunit KhtT